MCCPNIIVSKFVAIFILILQIKNFIFLRICFSLHENEIPDITPPEEMQTLLFLLIIDASTLA
jgi:hypothetical protein